MHDKEYYIYILASERNGTVYVGVTNSLLRRIYEHKNDLVEGFTKKYGVKLLVHYEAYKNINDAISREKQMKKSSRMRKIRLIEENNPRWKDLYEELTPVL